MSREQAKRISEKKRWRYFVIAAFALLALSCQLASLGASPVPTPLPFPNIIHVQADCAYSNPDPDGQRIDYAAIGRGECQYEPIPTATIPSGRH